jgi:hypothetical protein
MSLPKPEKDRRFDPSLIPNNPQLIELTRRAIDHAQAIESRARSRRAADQRTFERAVIGVVTNLVYAELEAKSRRVMVSLSKRDLSPARRRAPFLTERFRETVKLLGRAGIVDLELGVRNVAEIRQSTIAAGPWLADELARLDVRFEHIGRDPELLPPAVFLKSTKVAGTATFLPLPDSPEASRLVAEMHALNQWLAGAAIGWTGEPIDLGSRRLRRVFNDGSLNLGGRLWGGFWMGLSKDQRLRHLRIDDEPVASLDFAHMGVTLAYSVVETDPPPGDLYAIPGTSGSREGVKKILNALLCSSQIAERFPAGTKAYFPAGRKFADIREAIERHHPALVRLFGTAQALRQQYLESTVMVRALISLSEKGVVGLPIHDALLVRESHAPLAREVLEQCFREVTGLVGRVDIESVTTRQGISPYHLRESFCFPLRRGRKSCA